MSDKVAHDANGFFDRGFNIRPMAEVEIEIIHLQSAQCIVTGFENMFSTESVLIWLLRFRRSAKEDFARDKPGVAGPSGLFQDLAHDEFGAPSCVTLGIVEEIYAAFRRPFASMLRPYRPGSDFRKSATNRKRVRSLLLQPYRVCGISLEPSSANIGERQRK